MTIAASQSSQPNSVLERLGTDEHLGFHADTVFGLQLDYKVQNGTRASVQMVVRHDQPDGFVLEPEWFYIAQHINNHINVRAGQLRLPVFLYSSTVYVSNSFVWQRPPIEVYFSTQGITRYQGVDANLHWSLNDQHDFTIRPLIGRIEESIVTNGAEADVNSDTFGGLEVSYQNDYFLFRGSHFPVKVKLESQLLPALELDLQFSNIGLQTNLGNHEIIAEWVDFKTKPLGKSRLSYVSYNYQWQQWSPYLLTGYNKTTNDLNHSHTTGNTHAIGLRYDVTDSYSVKAEILRGNLVDGLQRLLLQPNFNQKVNLYSVSLNMTF